MNGKTKLKIAAERGLAKRKPVSTSSILERGLRRRPGRTAEEQVASLKNYIRLLDPPREPVTAVSRNSIYKDGFVPGWVWIKVLQKAQERPELSVRRSATKEKLKAKFRKWISAKAGTTRRWEHEPVL